MGSWVGVPRRAPKNMRGAVGSCCNAAVVVAPLLAMWNIFLHPSPSMANGRRLCAHAGSVSSATGTACSHKRGIRLRLLMISLLLQGCGCRAGAP